ncbi:hypothetical protein G4B88_010166 [Cannabis sativa]|uniref:UGP3-like C-terminal hexapeptide repeats domain-containing protein n=1 Tax=Cannabis sativa TaxID=3483 RepID=A0A7J6E383_CANSA|nr:hypothetical protein G4B88_010166 [Cannabis sativa]
MAAHSSPLLNHKNHFIFSTTNHSNSHSHYFLRLTKSPPLSFSFSNSNSNSSLSPSLSRFPITRVTTAPVEFAAQPTPPEFDIRREISRLKALRSRLSGSRSFSQKLRVVDRDRRVNDFFNSSRNGFSRVLASVNLSSYELFLLKCLVASGQEHVLCFGLEFEDEELESTRSSIKSALYALVGMIEKLDVNGGKVDESNLGATLGDEDFVDLKKLLKHLGDVEEFYDSIGGIIGYQLTVLELLAQTRVETQTTIRSKHKHEQMECQLLEIHSPNGVDLSQNTEYASQAALWGIEGLPYLGEIYPLGGAADRLGFVDPDTGECLPAAMLPYGGRTLLEVNALLLSYTIILLFFFPFKAREFLYYKIYGKQCITPVAIMTSSAKNNHDHITSLCEKLGWFGRGQSRFQLFEQPLVPAVSAEDGQWLVSKPFSVVCKPGGHGVIWKLANDKGIFKWFYDHRRKGATVRQVSNVVAATDLTLLALAGIGLHEGKKLGFASCKRNLEATEGINVLIEKKNNDGKWAYGLSCIEYTEFEKFGIADGHHSTNSLQAEFPANTNILYVDLLSAESVGSSNNSNSLPGMVLNTKKQISFVDYFGKPHSVLGGRLECTMQNIADNFFNTFPSQRSKDVEDNLDSFIVFNERRRVTSSAKKQRKLANKNLHQTPDGSLLDILRNSCDILSQCEIGLPEIEGNEKYISGPPFLILLHPALGPLWEVTRQKFNGGSISKGSELKVEVAEFLWRNVELDGSLIIEADNIMGSNRIDDNGEHILQYGHRCGRCRLENVEVQNQGVDWNCGHNVYWKHQVQRFESCKIMLHGNAEFEARDVTIQGDHIFEVPNGYKLKITTGMAVQLEPIDKNMVESGSWYWKYKIKGSHIELELVEF